MFFFSTTFDSKVLPFSEAPLLLLLLLLIMSVTCSLILLLQRAVALLGLVLIVVVGNTADAVTPVMPIRALL